MEHVLQLYQEESCLLDALADFVAAGLRLEEGVLIFGSTPRWDLLIDRLQKSGIDARAYAARGQLKFYGAHVLLSNCSSGGGPSWPKTGPRLGRAPPRARPRHPRARAVSGATPTRRRARHRAGAGGVGGAREARP